MALAFNKILCQALAGQHIQSASGWVVIIYHVFLLWGVWHVARISAQPTTEPLRRDILHASPSAPQPCFQNTSVSPWPTLPFTCRNLNLLTRTMRTARGKEVRITRTRPRFPCTTTGRQWWPLKMWASPQDAADLRPGCRLCCRQP